MESKKFLTPPDVPFEIAGLCRRVERWRRVRRHRERMPAPLWSLAASLARRHGVARIARMARLDYYAVKERLEALNPEPGTETENRQAFVELPLPSSVAVPECVVELEHPRGRRMHILVKGAPMPDLGALSRSFWSVES